MPDQRYNLEHLLQRLSSSDPSERARAAELLGFIEDARAVEPLCEALFDSDWSVRAVAASALGQCGDERAVTALCAGLSDPNWTVRPRAASALGLIGHPDAVEALARALQNDIWLVRKAAAVALGSIRCPEAEQTLRRSVDDSDEAVRIAIQTALRALEAAVHSNSKQPVVEHRRLTSEIPPLAARQTLFQKFLANRILISAGGDPALDLLVGQFNAAGSFSQAEIASQIALVVPDGIWALCTVLLNCTVEQATAAIRALASAGLLGAMAVCAALGHDVQHVCHAATDALELLTDQGAAVSLCAALHEEDDPYVRSRAAAALGRLGDSESIPTLLGALKVGDDAAPFAAQALAKFGDMAVPALCKALTEQNHSVRQLAIEALIRIDGRDLAPVCEALRHEIGYVRYCASEVLARLNTVYSIVHLCCAYDEMDMTVGATIRDVIIKQDADGLILCILREPGHSAKARLTGLTAVLKLGNRRKSKLARYGDVQRCCLGLADRDDVGPDVASGARAVLVELDRRNAGKTLLRAGSAGTGSDSLLRAAPGGCGELDSADLLRAAEVADKS